MKFSFSFFLTFILFFLVITSCNQNVEKQNTSSENLTQEVEWVKMLVEIPAGTIKKYELNKTTNQLTIDSIDGKPRLINYLGYPANYGMIPETILPVDKGGDGDPLDIISIGPPAEYGEIIECKIIGVLKLLDREEQDDKLIAISKNSTLKNVKSLEDLKTNYPGILEIIETWFKNYKGAGKMQSQGYHSLEVAQKVYYEAKSEYLKK